MIPSGSGFLKTYQVQQENIHFKDSWLYNDPFSEGTVIQTYHVTNSDVAMVGVNNEAYQKFTGYLNYRLVQAPVVITNAYTKEGIAEVIALIGGFIGLMKNLSYIILGSY